MLKAKDFRAQARTALKGKWKQAIIAGLIAGIMGGTVLYKGYSGSSASNTVSDATTAGFTWGIILAVVAIFVVVGVITFLIGSIVGLGYAKFNLELYKSETADFKMIFSEKSRYKDCFKLFLMQFLYVTIGSILFVIVKENLLHFDIKYSYTTKKHQQGDYYEEISFTFNYCTAGFEYVGGLQQNTGRTNCYY